MNSKQRRKEKRECPYTVTVYCNPDTQYFVHDAKMEAATKWCQKHTKGTWKKSFRWDHSIFMFSNHKDATIFTLKWV